MKHAQDNKVGRPAAPRPQAAPLWLVDVAAHSDAELSALPRSAQPEWYRQHTSPTDQVLAAAEVLYEADPFTTGTASVQREHNTREWQAVLIQAQALVDAGILPTLTEWGVLLPSSAVLRADSRRTAEMNVSPGTCLATQSTTPWKAVTS